MPKTFTGPFARRRNERCAMIVREATHGERLQRGMVFVAPGDRHMELETYGAGYRIRLHEGAPVSGHRPSVDVLMHSVARVAGSHALGALLTGMGRDGAEGLLNIRTSGGRTLAQDAASSVVYGMPKVAWEIGAAERRLSLSRVAPTLLQWLQATDTVTVKGAC